MRNRTLCFALYAVLLALCPSANAQQKVYRIGVVFPGGPMSETVDGLRKGMKELGFEEGKQFTLTIRDTRGDVKATADAAKAFEQEKVNLIYAIATTVITAAKEATQNVPIVFSIGSDPVALGLVNDFAKPGGRLTGVHYLVKDLTAKRLEILKEMLPKISRVVAFFDPTTRVAADGAALAREEAKRLGTQVYRTARQIHGGTSQGVAGPQSRRGGCLLLHRRRDGCGSGAMDHRHGKSQEAADHVSGPKPGRQRRPR